MIEVMSVGTLIRERREKLGLSQQALAEKAGITHSGVSRIEHGNRQPSLPVLRKIAAALGVDPGELLAEDDG